MAGYRRSGWALGFCRTSMYNCRGIVWSCMSVLMPVSLPVVITLDTLVIGYKRIRLLFTNRLAVTRSSE